MRNTKETVDFMLKAAAGKAATRAPRHFLLSVMAGVYIGFGAALAIKIAGNLNPEWGNLMRLIFGLLFPVGLLMVLTAGASLFTGEVMFMPSSLAAGGVGAGK